MARAKRTDRAEARRRYRAEVLAREAEERSADADQEPEADAESAQAATTAATDRPANSPSRLRRAPRSARSSAPPPPQSTRPARPNVLEAFRTALRPANIRADIVSAPAILRERWFLWIPFALVAVSGVLALIPALAAYQIPSLLIQTFLVPPPLIGPFLAGLLAPRAGWFFGFLNGLLAAIFYGIFVATAQVPAGTVNVTPEMRFNFILTGLLLSPVYGAAIGAFAGFYRRFLRATSPQRPPTNRRRPPQRGRR